MQLRQEMYDLIEELFSLPGAMPGVTENVFETLNLPSGLPEELLAPVTLPAPNSPLPYRPTQPDRPQTRRVYPHGMKYVVATAIRVMPRVFPQLA